MADVKKLEQFPVEDLRRELLAREAKAKGGPAAAAAATDSNNPLSEFDTPTIVRVLKASQKVIYGTDDRTDIFPMPAGANRDDVDSVVALFSAGSITDNGNGTSTLSTQNFGTANNLCAGERFRDQPTGAFCSGFLVAPDVIATAGHCINAGNVTTVRFVFGFRMRNATTAETVINNSEIYRGVSIIGRQEVSNGPDWALVRIDRAVTNHRIAAIRRSGKIGDTQTVHVIGHPSGLPTKFAGGAVVRSNTPAAFFVANLDTYGGNSGSPVFNSDNHQVEGILVRGEADFTAQGNCMVSLVCPTTGCRGEDVTRTTEFATQVPAATLSNPSMVQSRFGVKGNFELVVPDAAGGLAFYWRNNDNPSLPWNGPTRFGQTAGQVDAVSMIQGNFGAPGNLEVVARVGDRLAFFWRDSGPSFTWNGPYFFGTPGVTGNPCLIQSRFGAKGNFELVVPDAAGGLAFYWRNNDNPSLPWNGPTRFGQTAGQVGAVSMIQGNFGTPGNLELVARIGDRLAFFWRDSGPSFTWNGPFFFGSAGNSGNPALVQSRFGTKGNFELAVPQAGGGMAFYWRNNDSPSLPWNGPVPFGAAAGAVEALTMIQSNFGAPGNLELVARVGNRLAFFWRDSGPSFTWHGPFFIT